MQQESSWMDPQTEMPKPKSLKEKIKGFFSPLNHRVTVFAVVFAAIGSYALLHSFAATGAKITYNQMPACVNLTSSERKFIHSGNCDDQELNLNYTSSPYTWCAYIGQPNQWLGDGNCTVSRLSAPATTATIKTASSSQLAITSLRADPTSSSINFAWDSNPYAAIYHIYISINPSLFIDNWVSTPYYNVTGLQPSTSYTFTVYAYNAALGDSAKGPNASITASTCGGSDCSPPSSPPNLHPTDVRDTYIGLSWNPSTDNIRVTSYDVYRDDNLIYGGLTGTTFADSPLRPSTTYSYKVYAKDAAGNRSSPSTLTATTLGSGTGDTTKPTKPSNVTGVPVSSSRADLSWNASTDNVAVTAYGIYRNGTQVAISGAVNYPDPGLSASTTYSYVIYAYDAAGNTSDGSTPITTVVTPSPNGVDNSPPTAPSGLAGIAASSSQINLTWNASSDDVAVTGYRIYRNGNTVCWCGATSFPDTGLAANTTYTYAVYAYDAAGHQSTTSNVFKITTPSAADTTKPTAPTNLRATVTSSNQINLAWNSSTDNVGVTSYRLYRNGNAVFLGNGTSFSDTGLTPSTTYTYAVYAYDAAGNQSSTSNVASITTKAPQDITPPSTPANLTGSPVSGTQVDLAWSASTDSVGVTSYKLYRGSLLIYSSNGTSFSDTGLTPSTTYTYAVYAYDAAGNRSPSKEVTTTTLAGTNPGNVTVNVNATPSQIYDSQSTQIVWTVTGGTPSRCAKQMATGSPNNDTSWKGNAGFPGALYVTPSVGTYKYAIVCYNAAGSIIGSGTIVLLVNSVRDGGGAAQGGTNPYCSDGCATAAQNILKKHYYGKIGDVAFYGKASDRKYGCENPGDCTDIFNTMVGNKLEYGQGCTASYIHAKTLRFLTNVMEIGHFTIGVSAMCSDHHNDAPTGHSGGWAVDIDRINGNLMGQGSSSKEAQPLALMRYINNLGPSLFPRQLINAGYDGSNIDLKLGNLMIYNKTGDSQGYKCPSYSVCDSFYGHDTILVHLNHIHVGMGS